MDPQYRTVAAELARRIQSMIDPSNVDMHKIHTQTARTNREILLSWREDMDYHEAQTENQYERVYLVASDLRLLTLSEDYSGQGKWHSAHSKFLNHSFLHARDIDSLHESHWAIEIDGRYYELVRLHGARSKFSSDCRVEDNDRQVYCANIYWHVPPWVLGTSCYRQV